MRLPSHKDFMRKSYQLYRDMERRFQQKENKRGRVTRVGREIPFELDAFRNWLTNTLGGQEDGFTRCPWCKTPIDVGNLVPDHATPASRGGSLELDNLMAVCDRCNLRKGSLTVDEYRALLNGLDTFPEAARTDILQRLEIAVQLAMKVRREEARRRGNQPCVSKPTPGSIKSLTPGKPSF